MTEICWTTLVVVASGINTNIKAWEESLDEELMYLKTAKKVIVINFTEGTDDIEQCVQSRKCSLQELNKSIEEANSVIPIQREWIEFIIVLIRKLYPHFMLTDYVTFFSDMQKLIECPICKEIMFYDRFETKCKHSFHRKCFKDWIVTQNKEERTPSCPVCRRSAISIV